MLSVLSCSAQKKESQMNSERYDFKLMKRAKYDPLGIVRDDVKISIYSMTDDGAFLNEYPPLPAFHYTQITFYPNGKIKSKKSYVGDALAVGVSMYYDEKGNITKKVNEDEKFGNFKIEDILKFLEKEGCINLATGEGLPNIEVLDDGGVNPISGNFRTSIEPVDNKYWVIIITANSSNFFTETIYHLDKDTGEVLHKDSQWKFPIM